MQAPLVWQPSVQGRPQQVFLPSTVTSQSAAPKVQTCYALFELDGSNDSLSFRTTRRVTKHEKKLIAMELVGDHGTKEG